VQVRWSAAVSDPLTRFRGKHPIIEPLLEYRQLEASAARLAPPELYQDIRAGRPDHCGFGGDVRTEMPGSTTTAS
jgi:hypothetical protein